jgi:hypothetical protein
MLMMLKETKSVLLKTKVQHKTKLPLGFQY